MSDRGYVNLIRHLTRSTPTLPLETLQASIAHYLARPPLPNPGSPTPLVAAALSSPLFRPHTHATLSALALAFRHAVHLRVGVLKEEAEKHNSSLLSRGVNVVARLARWTGEVREGFMGSEALVRLVCASGLLLGLEDWEAELAMKEKEKKARTKVEEEAVLSLAEVVDEYAREGSGWETDFKRTVGAEGEEDPLALAVLFASQCAQCIVAERLQALPLSTVIDVLLTTIERAFYNGAFLARASMAVSQTAEGKATIAPSSSLAQTIRSVTGSPYIASMSGLARFTAQSLTILVESRRALGWESIGRTLGRFQHVTSLVEKDWEKCPLARVQTDEGYADDGTREIATATWSILKTLLFTTLMLSQSVLSAVVFVPAPHADRPPQTSARYSSSADIPHAIALNVLHILSHLSFVMPQLGGVASTSEGGLPELKRAFYMALDVLASSEAAAERFVVELSQRAEMVSKGKGVDRVPRSLLDARKAFALACVEQLAPILSEETIETRVYPLCLPHLWDPSYRETYESAHSVMLSIFAAHAQHAEKRVDTGKSAPAFAEKLVPMYARCLLENSSDGRLSTTQLCMAYAALVRSASSFIRRIGDSQSVKGDAMTWYCLEALLDAVGRERSAASDSISTPTALSEHLHRLHLALIASVPSVSLALLPRVLDEVKTVIVSCPSDTRGIEMRDELVQALFKGLLQDVGDAEKEYAIGWWYENREELAVKGEGVDVSPPVARL
ncbi:hypothetical protein BV20DRAFT_988973 [Pilatotrama ljubarskyi]|nr:hypothetical protein BV20DRAFT_988973 [Pilatotrama ljubarskyi]